MKIHFILEGETEVDAASEIDAYQQLIAAMVPADEDMRVWSVTLGLVDDDDA